MKAVDLSTDIAGRFAAKLFAMAGVEVVRAVVSRRFYGRPKTIR